MNNDPKYYCPKIEDIFIGYECQYFTSWETPQWKDRILDSIDFALIFEEGEFCEDWFKNDYRTKYLDEEDLLKLGFIQTSYDKSLFFKDKYRVEFVKFQPLYIYTVDKHGDNDFLFQGYCPSINELRKILKLVTHEIN